MEHGGHRRCGHRCQVIVVWEAALYKTLSLTVRARFLELLGLGGGAKTVLVFRASTPRGRYHRILLHSKEQRFCSCIATAPKTLSRWAILKEQSLLPGRGQAGTGTQGCPGCLPTRHQLKSNVLRNGFSFSPNSPVSFISIIITIRAASVLGCSGWVTCRKTTEQGAGSSHSLALKPISPLCPSPAATLYYSPLFSLPATPPTPPHFFFLVFVLSPLPRPARVSTTPPSLPSLTPVPEPWLTQVCAFPSLGLSYPGQAGGAGAVQKGQKHELRWSSGGFPSPCARMELAP